MLTPELSPPFLSFFNPRAPPSRPYSVISFTNERAASYDFVSRVYARLQTLRVRDSKVLPPPPPSLIHLENRLYGFLDRGGGRGVPIYSLLVPRRFYFYLFSSIDIPF